MNTIGISCTDQVLTFTNTPVISTGDQNVDKISFTFCPLWDGFVKVAIFYQEKGEESYALIGADNTCLVPNSIMQLTGPIYVGVSGTNAENQVRTSTIVRYTIMEGATSASLDEIYSTDISEEEQEDVYHKMLEITSEAMTLTQDLLTNFAYLRTTSGNEFEYNESALEAKIRSYTYSKSQVNEMIEANAMDPIKFEQVGLAGATGDENFIVNNISAYSNGVEIMLYMSLVFNNVTDEDRTWGFNIEGQPRVARSQFVYFPGTAVIDGENVTGPQSAMIDISKENDAYGIRVDVTLDEAISNGVMHVAIPIII